MFPWIPGCSKITITMVKLCAWLCQKPVCSPFNTKSQFKTESYEEAEALCRQEPLVAEGYATYILASLQVADKENNYLLT